MNGESTDRFSTFILMHEAAHAVVAYHFGGYVNHIDIHISYQKYGADWRLPDSATLAEYSAVTAAGGAMDEQLEPAFRADILPLLAQYPDMWFSEFSRRDRALIYHRILPKFNIDTEQLTAVSKCWLNGLMDAKKILALDAVKTQHSTLVDYLEEQLRVGKFVAKGSDIKKVLNLC